MKRFLHTALQTLANLRDLDEETRSSTSPQMAVKHPIGILLESINVEIICVSVYQVSCWQNATMYSWLNSIVSNRRMIVIVNDRYYAAYDVVHHSVSISN